MRQLFFLTLLTGLVACSGGDSASKKQSDGGSDKSTGKVGAADPSAPDPGVGGDKAGTASGGDKAGTASGDGKAGTASGDGKAGPKSLGGQGNADAGVPATEGEPKRVEGDAVGVLQDADNDGVIDGAATELKVEVTKLNDIEWVNIVKKTAGGVTKNWELPPRVVAKFGSDQRFVVLPSGWTWGCGTRVNLATVTGVTFEEGQCHLIAAPAIVAGATPTNFGIFREAAAVPKDQPFHKTYRGLFGMHRVGDRLIFATHGEHGNRVDRSATGQEFRNGSDVVTKIPVTDCADGYGAVNVALGRVIAAASADGVGYNHCWPAFTNFANVESWYLPKNLDILDGNDKLTSTYIGSPTSLGPAVWPPTGHADAAGYPVTRSPTIPWDWRMGGDDATLAKVDAANVEPRFRVPLAAASRYEDAGGSKTGYHVTSFQDGGFLYLFFNLNRGAQRESGWQCLGAARAPISAAGDLATAEFRGWDGADFTIPTLPDGFDVAQIASFYPQRVRNYKCYVAMDPLEHEVWFQVARVFDEGRFTGWYFALDERVDFRASPMLWQLTARVSRDLKSWSSPFVIHNYEGGWGHGTLQYPTMLNKHGTENHDIDMCDFAVFGTSPSQGYKVTRQHLALKLPGEKSCSGPVAPADWNLTMSLIRKNPDGSQHSTKQITTTGTTEYAIWNEQSVYGVVTVCNRCSPSATLSDAWTDSKLVNVSREQFPADATQGLGNCLTHSPPAAASITDANAVVKFGFSCKAPGRVDLSREVFVRFR